MFKKKFSLVTLFVLLIVGFGIGTQINLISGDNIYEQLGKFRDVLNYTQKYYVDEVDTPKLVESAISGMLRTLDPHSVYIPPKQLEKVQEDFKGSFEGIGIEFNVLHDTLTVVSPIFDGPSEKVGILAGDKIISIDGVSCIKITNEDVQKKLRGPKGTKVTVDILRAGVKDKLQFTIIRDKIPLYSVDTQFMLDDGIGYVSVNRFAQNTHQEFVDALRSLKAKGMKKLILDLRQNPGGYLDQAFKMANEFLKQGVKVVYTKGRRAEFDDTFIAKGSGEFQNIALIILIANSSASASEIVAGAVQDHDRGLIVGETSFGKGLVQRQFDLADGSAFRLTTARYFTPSGRLIQRAYKSGESEEDYYREAYTRDEKDTANISHTAESDTSKPRFKTDGGRTVYGGGGITPDYIVKMGRLTDYTGKMRSRVFEFISGYMDKYSPELRKQYSKEDVDLFISNFQISEDLMQSFIEHGKKNKIEFNQEQFDKDRKWIAMWLKSQIARNLFGNEGYFKAFLEVDNQFQKALTLFPEAMKIADLR